jgi:hypothetical protein
MGNTQVITLFERVKENAEEQAQESTVQEEKDCEEEAQEYENILQSFTSSSTTTDEHLQPRQLGFDKTSTVSVTPKNNPPVLPSSIKSTGGKELRQMTRIDESSPMVNALGNAETPMSVGGVRTLVKTTSTTEPVWLLVNPDGTSQEVQMSQFFGGEGSIVAISVSGKHIFTLSEEGQVTAFDFLFHNAKEEEPKQTPKTSGWGLIPAFLRPASSSTSSGTKAPPSPTYRMVFPNDEVIVTIHTHGTITMAVDESGVIWSWTDSDLTPQQVLLDDDSVGKVVNVTTGGTFFICECEDNSIYAFRKIILPKRLWRFAVFMSDTGNSHEFCVFFF